MRCPSLHHSARRLLTYWLPFLLAIGGAVTFASSRAPAAQVEPGEVAMDLELLTDHGQISACEPLLARITLRALGEREIWVPLGNGQVSFLELEVISSEGQVLASTPPPPERPVGEFGLSGAQLAPGKPRMYLWVVSGLHTFREPGRYTIRMQLLAWREGLPALCEASAPVEVLPYDRVRLDARCAELLRPGWMHNGSGDLDLGSRVLALYSVRDDVVLPYLAWIACEWAAQYACRAIRRLGMDRARRLLEVLQARTDRVGRAARSIPEMADVTLWDIIYGPIPLPKEAR
jgi:hypothetical protein